MPSTGLVFSIIYSVSNIQFFEYWQLPLIVGTKGFYLYLIGCKFFSFKNCNCAPIAFFHSRIVHYCFFNQANREKQAAKYPACVWTKNKGRTPQIPEDRNQETVASMSCSEDRNKETVASISCSNVGHFKSFPTPSL